MGSRKITEREIAEAAKRFKNFSINLHSPGPWRLSQSKGGRFYLYAANESKPINNGYFKLRKGFTRQELANIALILLAVNEYLERYGVPKEGA